MIVKYVPSAISLIAAAVARLASSNLLRGDSIEDEQSMMMASTRSGGADASRGVISDRDAHDRVDRSGPVREVRIVINLDRNALLFSGTHCVSPIGMMTTVMLSWPPALSA